MFIESSWIWVYNQIYIVHTCKSIVAFVIKLFDSLFLCFYLWLHWLQTNTRYDAVMKFSARCLCVYVLYFPFDWIMYQVIQYCKAQCCIIIVISWLANVWFVYVDVEIQTCTISSRYSVFSLAQVVYVNCRVIMLYTDTSYAVFYLIDWRQHTLHRYFICRVLFNRLTPTCFTQIFHMLCFIWSIDADVCKLINTVHIDDSGWLVAICLPIYGSDVGV